MSLPGQLQSLRQYEAYLVNTVTVGKGFHSQKEYTVTVAKLGVLRESRRLAHKGVETGCKYLLAVQCIGKCLLVHDPPSGCVDQDCGRLHRFELFRPDHVFGGWSKWDMYGDDVGPAEKIIDVGDQVYLIRRYDRAPGV